MSYSYTTLTTAIQDYVVASGTPEASFVGHIPDFIRQAETRLAQAIRTPDMKQSASFNIGPGSPLGNLGSIAFVSVNEMLVSSDLLEYTPVLQKELSWIREAYAGPAETGTPRYYAIDYVAGAGSGQGISNQQIGFRFGPWPDTTYFCTLDYFGQSPSIVDYGGSWYGNVCPDLLLYECLVEAYAYLKGDPDMLKFVTDRAGEERARVQRMAESLQQQDAFRNGDIRRPIT